MQIEPSCAQKEMPVDAEVGQAQKTGYPSRTSVLAKVAEKEAIPLLMCYFLGMQGRTDAGASEG